MADIIETKNGKIVVKFKKGDTPFVLSDALWFTEEVYNSITPEEIEAIKQQRYDDWYAIVESMVNNPQPDITDVPVETTETPVETTDTITDTPVDTPTETTTDTPI
jgi:hypothetical protein